MVRVLQVLAVALAIGFAAACAQANPPLPKSTSSPALTKAPYTLPPPTPSLVAIGSPGLRPPGLPYSSADVATLLQAAPRGFPVELKTEATAEAFASRIWSFDGQPFRRLLFDGSCESRRCEVSATGLPAFASTLDQVDVFTLVLDQASGIYSEPSPPTLRGLPQDLVPTLDEGARGLDAKGEFKAKPLLGVEWLIPPPVDAFVLRYGNGNEEQDPTLLVVLSRAQGKILSITSQ